jgi:hypothetical protein
MKMAPSLAPPVASISNGPCGNLYLSVVRDNVALSKAKGLSEPNEALRVAQRDIQFFGFYDEAVLCLHHGK